MSGSDLSLLRRTRFLPLFVTQFFGALNDNLFKQALVILITYRLASGDNAQLLVTAAAGIFIFPFFLFSAMAGQLADKYDKAQLARYIKLAEIVLVVIAAIGLYAQSVSLLMLVLFLLGTHATFFGPIKYSILPEHLHEDELIAGNALIETGTFIAILLGTILGGVLILMEAGTAIVSLLLIACAIIGFIASTRIPPAVAVDPHSVIHYNILAETWNIMRFGRENRAVFLSILGISWFWLIGATLLSQFPTLGKDVLHASEHVVTLFLTVFSVGIGIGSMWCNRLLAGKVNATYVPVAALGMTLFGIDLYYSTAHAWITENGAIMGVGEFLSHLASWRILLDMLGLSVCGGVYIVPLYAIMQSRSERSHRSRIIASNNVMNALFMVAAAVFTMLLLMVGFSVPEVFLTLAILNLFTAIYICRLLPDALVRSIVRWLLTVLYRVEVKGKEQFDAAGERVLIIANHTSFLDAVLIAAFLPETVTFAINTHIAKLWWMKPMLALVDTYPLDPTNPIATKSLIDLVKKNRKCMIFPEGRITVTGSLMKVYEGPGMIADKSGAMILPIRIDGAQYTPFSRLKGKVRIRWFPKVTLTLLAPRRFEVDAEVKGRARRAVIGNRLYDVMTEMMFDSSDYKQTLFQGLLTAQAIHGGSHVMVEDTDRKPLTYRQLIMRSYILGNAMRKQTAEGEYVGVLLPNMAGTIVTFFGLLAFGRVVAMLNFSTGAANMAAACKTAQIKTVYTSRRFIEAGNLQEAVAAIEATGTKVRYMEEFKQSISFLHKLCGMCIAHLMPELYYHRLGKKDPHSPAVILFTSGSEGTPKGVVLSHTNLQANIFQLAARVDFGPQDIVFNCLPVFHSFGLTGGTILPLLSGIRAFFYPSPLHYRIVPELVYDTNATMIFGTDTFLSAYAKYAHPYDFHSLRYVFAGAEKLKEATRKIWAEKYGVRIFEGYGATETAPVLAVNTPMQSRAGSVGRLVPAVQYRLENVPGIAEGGKLQVKGPNIMLGYLLSSNPGVLVPPEGGWYDTGDVVTVDTDGYVTIKGRTKRFAKIGGEMVSLTAVEGYASALWPDGVHAAVSIPDEKKGEQVILVTTTTAATREQLLAYAKEQGISELFIPKTLRIVESVPLLGSGKIDYVTTRQLVTGE